MSSKIQAYLNLHDELVEADTRYERTGADVDQRYADSISSEMSAIYSNASPLHKEALRCALEAHIERRIKAR